MLNWLRRILGQIWNALGGMFTQAVDTETGIFDAYFSMKDDFEAAVRTLEDFKHFDFAPQWKTKVISVPRAIEGINDLFDIVVHQLKDKFTEVRDVVREIVNIVGEQRGPPEEGAGGIANVQAKLATIKLITVRLKTAMHGLLQLEQMLSDVKSRVETLDDLFLPQGSTKKTVDIRYRKRNG
jgi:hypothetical protein